MMPQEGIEPSTSPFTALVRFRASHSGARWTVPSPCRGLLRVVDRTRVRSRPSGLYTFLVARFFPKKPCASRLGSGLACPRAENLAFPEFERQHAHDFSPAGQLAYQGRALPLSHCGTARFIQLTRGVCKGRASLLRLSCGHEGASGEVGLDTGGRAVVVPIGVQSRMRGVA